MKSAAILACVTGLVVATTNFAHAFGQLNLTANGTCTTTALAGQVRSSPDNVNLVFRMKGNRLQTPRGPIICDGKTRPVQFHDRKQIMEMGRHLGSSYGSPNITNTASCTVNSKALNFRARATYEGKLKPRDATAQYDNVALVQDVSIRFTIRGKTCSARVSITNDGHVRNGRATVFRGSMMNCRYANVRCTLR